MDKGRDLFDGRRETGSGVLVISAEFGNFGTCIVDISTEGGNEFISGDGGGGGVFVLGSIFLFI